MPSNPNQKSRMRDNNNSSMRLRFVIYKTQDLGRDAWLHIQRIFDNDNNSNVIFMKR